MATVTPAPSIPMVMRAHRLARGDVRIPFVCGKCGSRNLDTNEDRDISCLNCGRSTTRGQLRQMRRQRMQRYIKTGER